MPVPVTGAVWTARIFRDSTPELRLFRISRFGNMSIGVFDLQQVPEREIFFSKSDVQFLDYVEGPTDAEEVQIQGDRKPDPGTLRSGNAGDDGGIRPERDRQDRIRRDVPQTPVTPRHPGKGR